MATTIKLIDENDMIWTGTALRTIPKYYGNNNHATCLGSFYCMSNFNDLSVTIKLQMGRYSKSDTATGTASTSITAPANTTGKVYFSVNDSTRGDRSRSVLKYIFDESKINGGVISLDTPYSKTLGIEEYVYYSFTPTKTGSYTMSFTENSDLKGWIATNTNNNSSSGYSTGSITQELVAGTTYYLGIKNITTSNYSSGISTTITLTYNPIIKHIHYVYNGQDTIINKEEDSFDLTPISDLGYTLDGWNFEGWTDTLSSFEVKYKNGVTFTPIEGITEYYLYPIWSKFFTINYKYGYPTSITESEKAYMYSYETTTDIEDPTATSTHSQTSATYTIKTITETFTYDDRLFSPEVWYIGLTNNSIQMGNKNFPISSNMNLNLAYLSSNLSLFFDGNNEKVQGSTSNITTIPQRYYCSNEAFQTMAVVAPECGFSLSGKKFKEWNSSPDGKGTSYKVGDLIKLSTNTTVYVIWISADEPFIFLSNKQIKPYLFKNNKYYEIKFM